MGRLDLGQFSRCVDYLSDDHIAEYSVDANTYVVYCPNLDDKPLRAIGQPDGSMVTIPTFEIGVCTPDGKTSDINTIDNLMALVELKIMALIGKLLDSSGRLFQIIDVHIPVNKIQFFDDDKAGGCYGWVNVGVSVIATPKPVVSC